MFEARSGHGTAMKINICPVLAQKDSFVQFKFSLFGFLGCITLLLKNTANYFSLNIHCILIPAPLSKEPGYEEQAIHFLFYLI